VKKQVVQRQPRPEPKERVAAVRLEAHPERDGAQQHKPETQHEVVNVVQGGFGFRVPLDELFVAAQSGID